MNLCLAGVFSRYEKEKVPVPYFSLPQNAAFGTGTY